MSKRATQIAHKQQQKALFERRKSTGSSGVMNSHAPALNLQATGQTVVVGHHRGFSQPSSATSGDPWFLQTSTSHPMPPTAPARHNKRPAPQPGSIIQQNNASASNHTTSAITQSQLPPHPPVRIMQTLSAIFEFKCTQWFCFYNHIIFYLIRHPVHHRCIRLPLRWTHPQP